MRMLRCDKCGFSFMLSRIYKWHDDGTVTYRLANDFRVMLYYSDLLTGLFTRIEEDLGLPIGHIVFEAQRNASKEAIGIMMSRLPYRLHHNILANRVMVRIFCRLAIWMGAAYARTLHYRYEKSGEALLRNPYNRELMAALILGAFESMEGRPYEREWIKSGGDDVIRVTATQVKPEVSERMVIVQDKSRPGNRRLPRCSRCGAPQALSTLAWDEFQGTITDTRLGERVNFMEAYANKAVLRELEAELGEAINPLIVQAAKDFARRHLEKIPGIKAEGAADRGTAWQSFTKEAMTMLPAWGHGNPVEIRQDAGRAVVTIDNPFEERLIAGYLAAGYELVEGRACEVEWVSPETGRCVFTISGA